MEGELIDDELRRVLSKSPLLKKIDIDLMVDILGAVMIARYFAKIAGRDVKDILKDAYKDYPYDN